LPALTSIGSRIAIVLYMARAAISISGNENLVELEFLADGAHAGHQPFSTMSRGFHAGGDQFIGQPLGFVPLPFHGSTVFCRSLILSSSFSAPAVNGPQYDPPQFATVARNYQKVRVR